MGYANDFYPTSNEWSGNNVNDGKWYQVVVTFDGSMLEIYVDAAKVAQSSKTYDTQDHRNFLGKSNHAASPHYFDGEVKNLAIWDSVLDPSEAAAAAAKVFMIYFYDL